MDAFYVMRLPLGNRGGGSLHRHVFRSGVIAQEWLDQPFMKKYPGMYRVRVYERVENLRVCQCCNKKHARPGRFIKEMASNWEPASTTKIGRE